MHYLAASILLMACFTSLTFAGGWTAPPPQPGGSPGSSTVNPTSASSFAVPRIPAFNNDINDIVGSSFAGYIDVGDISGNGASPGNPTVSTNMFFWYFPGPVNSTDLVVFLNGGPGCLVGMFRGVGPIRYTSMGDFYANPSSWHKQAHLVFIDQPSGTGFSFNSKNKIPTDEGQISTGLHQFLTSFMTMFQMTNFNVVLAGESFAGQYIPYLVKKIYQQNLLAILSGTRGISIKGMLLISPWIDASRQYKSYVPFIHDFNIIPANSSAWRDLDLVNAACNTQIAKKSQTFIPVCASIVDFARSFVESSSPDSCFNEYDIRQTILGICPGQVTYGDLKLLYLLNDPSFRDAIHTNTPGAPSFFYPCSQTVLQALSPDGSPPSIGALNEILYLTSFGSSLPIHIVSAKFDMIVNPLGVRWALGNMTAGGRALGLALSTTTPWLSSIEDLLTFQSVPDSLTTQVFGTVSSFENRLFFYIAESSGHYIPADQTTAASQVLTKILKKKCLGWFNIFSC
ncbi:Cell death protease [Phlyctochytrium planicorne]|nr:Cell death protease [Phlyctochytrium planicorne]